MWKDGLGKINSLLCSVYVVKSWNLNNSRIILCIIRERHDEVMKPALVQIQVWEKFHTFPTLITFPQI